MLQSLTTRLHEQLEEDLDLIQAEEHDPLKRMSSSVCKVRKVLDELKEFVVNHPFGDKREEIHFFKQTKPGFLFHQFYHWNLYVLDHHKPCGTCEMLQSYYEQELDAIKRSFLRHRFLYDYYRRGMDQLDELYFLRDAEAQELLLPEAVALDPEFSTCGDMLFSKFMAHERLIKEILLRMNTLEHQSVITIDGTLSGEKRKLKWTGESINLVELGYGLYHSGQLNHGNASINDIFRWLEGQLEVSIGKPSRRLTEIKRRKRLSQTKYLDQMRDQLLQQIDEENAYLR